MRTVGLFADCGAVPPCFETFFCFTGQAIVLCKQA